jgi:hypothetical protein
LAILKPVINLYEEAALRELQQLGDEYGYNIYPKMRLADVLPIDKKPLSRTLYSFALQAHFDFTACDLNNTPVFVVEFDGHFHSSEVQRRRDAKKDKICELFEFPLLRMNSNHLLKHYNRMFLLSWIISAWELEKSFNEAQAKGLVPADEPFDPIFLFHPGNTIEEVHPRWISLRGRQHIQEWYKEDKLPYPCTSGIFFTDQMGTYRGIEWIDVGERRVVMVTTAMKQQNFPMYLGELFSELISVLMYEKLLDYLRTGNGSVPPESVEDLINSYVSLYKWAGSHGGGTSVTYFQKLLANGDWLIRAGVQQPVTD